MFILRKRFNAKDCFMPNDKLIKQIRETNLHPEAYLLESLGEDFTEGAVMFTATPRTPFERGTSIASDFKREKLMKEFFWDFEKFTKRNILRDKKTDINFYWSTEIGAGSVHFNGYIFKEGFKNFDYNLIIPFTKKKFSRWCDDREMKISTYKKHLNSNSISFTSYINKKEKVYNDLNDSYSIFEKQHFFSRGLKHSILENN